ncbi:MAG: glycosyltransferase family 2 protein [Cellulomonadaceae bacterium]
MSPLVRVVVVNWNGADLLPACLESVLAQDLPPDAVETVVVDNASTDGSVALLRSRFPNVQVVQNAMNTGFAGGVEEGLKNLTASFVTLLNNDARLEPDAVRVMVETLESEPGLGAVTALILLDDQSSATLVNSTGNIVLTSGSATDRDWMRPLDELDSPPEVFGFCGGAATLRTRALDDVGGFDTSLFLYYEDTDLSWRLRAAGWDIRFERGAVAWHRHAASTGTTSPVFRFYNNRNALIVLARYAPGRTLLRAVARQLAAPVRHTLSGDEPRTMLRARFRALAAALPRLCRERRRGRHVRRALADQPDLWTAPPA